MPKSLKEALLEQLGALQERGLAPAEMPEPDEPEEPAYQAYASASGAALATRPRPARPRPRPDLGRRDTRNGRGRTQRVAEGDESEDSDRPSGRARRPARPAAPGGRFRRSEPEAEMAPVAPSPVASPVSRTDLLRERAEQRRRDDVDRQEIVEAMQSFRGEAPDEEALTAFFAALTDEVGVLPPLRVVGLALKAAQTDQADKVGDQVRIYYRSARARRA